MARPSEAVIVIVVFSISGALIGLYAIFHCACNALEASKKNKNQNNKGESDKILAGTYQRTRELQDKR